MKIKLTRDQKKQVQEFEEKASLAASTKDVKKMLVVGTTGNKDELAIVCFVGDDAKLLIKIFEAFIDSGRQIQ